MMGCQSPKCPDAARITLTGVKHVLFLTLLMGILLYGITEAGEKAEHKTVARRMSYSIGYQVGGDMKLQQIAVDPKVLLQGVQDALAARTPFLTPLEMREVLAELQKKILADQEAQMKKEAENNLEQGRAFLENNLKKEGVKALPSGLQYRVLRE